MHSYQFWLLFIYITTVLIVEAYHWYILTHAGKNEVTYHCDEETTDRIVGLAPLKPDENGVVGMVSDSNGVKYYLVIVPKDEVDKALNNEETPIDYRKD